MPNEKRLISLDEALNATHNEIWWTESLQAAVRSFLVQQPRVDAVEVVHAQWEEWWPPKHMILTGEEMLYRCSACDAKYADTEGYKYCPHCGAKMDGG